MRRIGQPLRRLRPDAFRNTVAGARRNIAAHYDLGNALFETFLDRDAMMYSCALYVSEHDSLEQAQRAKLERICRSLELGPDTHLLEIGTGWGGLAVHAATHYGCRVTTTTISREQRAYAAARIRRAGLDGLVRVIGQDYRELEGRFDRLASIEMIEAVGWEYFDLFFRRCSQLLVPDGLMFLQAICIDDHAYEAEKDAPNFSNRMIFPGGCLPSLEAIARCLASQTDMRTVWLEDISPSYALTLRAWRERFLAAGHNSRTSATTGASSACGRSICRSPRPDFARHASWTCRCSARSRPGDAPSARSTCEASQSKRRRRSPRDRANPRRLTERPHERRGRGRGDRFERASQPFRSRGDCLGRPGFPRNEGVPGSNPGVGLAC